MSARPDRIRCLVVKHGNPDYSERPWIAACMSAETAAIIGTEDFDKWKRKALPLALPEWEEYECREVIVHVPQDQLDAVFSVQQIDAEVA